jgi:hypothetical protein
VKFEIRLNDRVKMAFGVPETLLEKMDTTKMVVLHDGKEVALEELCGDVVLDVENITIAQIAWLLKNREVIYLYRERKDDMEMVSIGLMRNCERYTGWFKMKHLGKKPPKNRLCGNGSRCFQELALQYRISYHLQQSLLEAADWIKGLNDFNCICKFNKHGINVACKKCLFDDAIKSMRISVGEGK